MAKKAMLSWFQPRRQWRKRKKINGKIQTWYLGESGINKTDRAGYEAALAEWRVIAGDIEQEPEQKRLDAIKHRNIDLLERVAEVRNRHALDPEDAQDDVFMTKFQVLQSEAFNHPDFALPGFGTAQVDTITQAIDQYLAHFQSLVKVGDRSPARSQPLTIHLHQFRDWAKAGVALQNVNGTMLAKYHAHLIERLGKEQISAAYAHDLLGSVKQWVRWCWQNELTNTLPRNLDTLNVRIPARQVKTLQRGEVLRLLDTAEGRISLYLSLALLCGMTAKDMADLKHGEVNFKVRTITRKRSKTDRHVDVPVVCYKLPLPLMKLLKEHASDGGRNDRLLLTAQGHPLVHGKRSDSVRLAFDRLVKQVNQQTDRDGKPLPKISASMKLLRATSADALEQSREYKSVTGQWLGHSPRSVKDRHYVNIDQKLLDGAVGWLTRRYGLDGQEA